MIVHVKTAHNMQWNIGDRQLRDINGIVNTKTEGQNRELCLSSTPLLNSWDVFIGSC